MRSYLVCGLWFVALTACVSPTRFEGAAKVPNGVTGCRQSCSRDGLEFGGFVYSGEFATSCICQPAHPATAAGASSNPTAGVIVQTQAAAAAAAANNSQQLRMQQQQQQTHHY
jgi:hypothetical protein